MRQDELNIRIEDHLKNYKDEVLRDKSNDELKVDLRSNFIKDSFELMTKYYNKESIKSYGGDLKSPKVLGMNLFLPLFENSMLLKDVLAHVLERNGEELGKVKDIDFDRVLNRDFNNALDLFIELETGEKIYFEFTYWEDNFGSFIGENNQELWEKEFSVQRDRSLYLKEMDRQDFCKNFRINRNISLLEDESDYIVFIYPFENEALKERMEEFDFENLKKVDLHELLYFILKRDLTEEEEEYYREFSRKYLIY